mgnify:CR=1 FL=1
MSFVRPIVRGKKNASVEFGPKLAVSIVEGFTFMEKLSFDAFNEGITLQDSLEQFKERHGHYPAVVYADKIYRNRDNLRFCKKHNICLSGPPLGRPSKDPKVLKEQRKQEREDTKIRNGVAPIPSCFVFEHCSELIPFFSTKVILSLDSAVRRNTPYTTILCLFLHTFPAT